MYLTDSFFFRMDNILNLKKINLKHQDVYGHIFCTIIQANWSHIPTESYPNVFSKESGIIHEFGLSVYYVGVYAVLISSLGI